MQTGSHVMQGTGKKTWGSRIVALLLLAMGASCGGPESPPVALNQLSPEATGVTLYLVRHAERLDDTTDPPLSSQGQARAERLAHALAVAGIQEIGVTQYLRTQETGRPLAEAAGVPVQVFQVESGELDHHLTEIRDWVEEGKADTLLLVGHSNTVPAVLESLTGVAMEEVAHDQYDDLLVIHLPAPPGRPVHFHLQY
ncbi:MAG: phosphoglycerate mutase family protein [Gemmatimonadota bacterium]